MALLKARAKLVEGFLCVISNERYHAVVTDLQPEKGGSDRGPTALELAVMALAGCVATVYTVVAKRSKVEIHGLAVDVEAEELSNEVIKAKVRINVKSPADEGKLKSVLDVTLENCPVGILFRKAGVHMDVSMEVSK